MSKNKDNFPRKIDRESIPGLATPSGSPTWQPVPHDFTLSLVEQSLAVGNMNVSEGLHLVSHGDLRYMGRLIIPRVNEDGKPQRDLVVGVVNTNDKSLAAKVLAGVRFGSGYAFFSEVSISRKHTKNIFTDFPGRVAKATTEILSKFNTLDQRYDAYGAFVLTPSAAHDLIIRGLDRGAYPSSAIPRILEAYRAGEPNAFGLFSAVVKILNEDNQNPFNLPERTHALHGVLDEAVGVDLAEGNRMVAQLAI